MSFNKLGCAALLTMSFVMSGCVTTTPPPLGDTQLSEDPFVITVPKNLVNTDGSALKGVNLSGFTNYGKYAEIRNFFSVNFVTKGNELVTEVCRGDYHVKSGSRDQSCVYFDAQVAIEESETSFKIIMAPYRMRSSQGKNAIYFPIKLPDVTIKDWYGWLGNHSVSMKYKTTSQYAPESIKGNFDRKLTKHFRKTGEANAALRQFKDQYSIPVGNETSVIVGASFFPYQNGSMVEMHIEGNSTNSARLTSYDWVSTLSSITRKLDEVTND